jgi:hypothetical protein
MKELELKFGTKKTVFQPDGKVAVVAADGTRTVKGAWRSEAKGAETKESVLRYDINGAAQPPVPVKYSFNKSNQLTAIIPAAANGGADSEECVFLGQILIDDAHDLIYSVIKPDGTPSGNKITVYGDLHFTEDSSNLVIEMKDGLKAEIKGEKGPSGVAMLKAEKNLVQEFKANDLLRVIAFTRNQLSTTPTPVPTKAQIEFVGKWDINPNSGQLVFLSKITGDLTKPDVSIAFAGAVKGVTVGFAYFADQAGTKLVFNMKGEHRWNATTAKWELSMGHSERKFHATFEGQIEKKTGDQTFVLSGKMNLELEQGKAAKLDLKIEGTYQFNKNKKLVFAVDVATSNGKLTYDLSVEGTFAFKSGTLTFTVRLNSQDTGGPKATIELAFKGNQASLIKQLSLVLDITPDKVQITFEFEMRMHWVNGVLVKDQPKPIVAAAPNN